MYEWDGWLLYFYTGDMQCMYVSVCTYVAFTEGTVMSFVIALLACLLHACSAIYGGYEGLVGWLVGWLAGWLFESVGGRL